MIRSTSILLLGAALALGACGKREGTPDQPPRGETMAPTDEWVAENPTEPAVPVELPTTHMTNVPVEQPSASPSPKAT